MAINLPIVYSQWDTRWASLFLGFNTKLPFNFYNYACLISCLAMVARYYGKDETPAAARMRQMRERNKAEQSVTEIGDGVLIDNSTKIDRKNNNTPPTPLSILKTTLDAERAEAVVEHRKRLRKPLTCRAAKLLGAEFAKWADPKAAADEMIARGWLGFKPEWMKNGKDPPGSVVPFKPSGPQRTWAEQRAAKKGKST